MQVLVISDLYPNPTSSVGGIFIRKQVQHLRPYCDQIVVSPQRLFPHLRLWKHFHKPKILVKDWSAWIEDLKRVPDYTLLDDIPIYYPSYTSLPKQIFQGTWGFFAYPFLYQGLREIHAKNPIQLIHAHYASPSGVIAILSKKWMKVPIVLSIHGSDITYTAKQNPISAAIIRWVFNNVDAIIANSSWTVQKIIQYGGDKNKITMVRYGGDLSPGDKLPVQKTQSDTTINILSVGYLKKSKGQYYVIQAVRRLIDVGYQIKYKIVGDGPDYDDLIKHVSDLNLEGVVEFEGSVPNNSVGVYYQSCDLFVLPSWNEAFGIVYIEALGIGKPVIGCIGSGGPEDIKSLGDCIELVKPGDVDSLVQAIKLLIDDPEKRRRMGEVGKKIVAENYTWVLNASETLTIYQELVSQAAH